MADLRRFLRELRRRKVYHVAAAYVVVGLGVLGAAELVLDPLGLGAARTLVVVLVLLGFPLALVLAWAYEVRPDEGPVSDASESAVRPGGRSPSPVDEQRPGGGTPPEARRAHSSSPDRAQGTAVPQPRPPAQARGSIAVLPFDDMSPEEGSEYFADGITEELTHALARLGDLRVAARTSAFVFKGGAEDVREIGRRLGVAHVVEGSVRRAGRKLRITAQLVDTTEGYHLWSERYDRELDDVFAIQDEIVEKVVRKLSEALRPSSTSLSDPGPETTPTVPRSGEMGAYDAYLRARHGYRSFRPGQVAQALRQAEEAVRLDPDFAPAHAVMAEILVLQTIGFGAGGHADLMSRAGAAAERALELDPELPEPHMARGVVHLLHEWRFADARRELEKSLQLAPSMADAHMWMEFYWTYAERDEERALASADRAFQLSPLDPAARSRRGTVLYLFGHHDAAVEEFRAMLDADPDAPLAHIGLGDALLRAGRLEEAAHHAFRSLEAEDRSDAVLGVSAGTLGVAGHEARARRLVEELEERNRERGGTWFWIACGRAGLGDREGAFEALERALEEREPGLIYLRAMPERAGLHDDPRFETLLERMGLGHLAPDA